MLYKGKAKFMSNLMKGWSWWCNLGTNRIFSQQFHHWDKIAGLTAQWLARQSSRRDHLIAILAFVSTLSFIHLNKVLNYSSVLFQTNTVLPGKGCPTRQTRSQLCFLAQFSNHIFWYERAEFLKGMKNILDFAFFWIPIQNLRM